MTGHHHETAAPDGTMIAWSEQGDAGTTVVLVHGITESSETWRPVIERLSETHRVVSLDLRGHGRSGPAHDMSLEALVGDVAAVSAAAAVDRPHLVGHSLGGVVVSAAGAVLPVASVVNVDQPLRLAAFQSQLRAVEPMLRDPATFPAVMTAMFDDMAGTLLSAEERARTTACRRLDQDTVLGVWDLTLTASIEDLDAAVDAALEPYTANDTPYLSLFGLDPGPDYDLWLTERIPTAVVERWEDHGHYPHLVDPDRFVDRLREFWES